MTVLAGALIAPAVALAQGAAGDQYTEQPPTAGTDGSDGAGGFAADSDSAGGSDPTSGSPDPTSGSPDPATAPAEGPATSAGPLTEETARNFDKKPDGQAAANLAQKSAPDSDALRDAALQAQSSSGDGGTESFGATSSDEGTGVGVGLVMLLIAVVAITLAGGAYWFWRRRQDEDPRAGDGSPSTA